MLTLRHLAIIALLLSASYARAAEMEPHGLMAVAPFGAEAKPRTEGNGTASPSSLPSGAWASFPLLQSVGAVAGYPDGTLKLHQPITRAEAVKVLVSSDSDMRNDMNVARKSGTVALYPDVAPESWYGPYIAVASKRNLMTGFPDGTMRPGRSLTVAEAVTLIERSARIKRENRFRTSSYLENVPHQWFTEAVSAAIARNLSSEPLEISSPILRGQFFTMVERLRNAEKASSFAYAPSVKTSPHGLSSRLFPLFSKLPSEPLPLRFASGKPFAITIPDLKVEDIAVVHPPDTSTQDALLLPLSGGLGHLFSYPGEGGKILIYGHSSNWPWVRSEYAKLFRELDSLKKRDRLYVTYGGTMYTYEVVYGRSVSPEDRTAFDPDESGEELILYTCWPPDTTQERFLVHARLVERVSLL